MTNIDHCFGALEENSSILDYCGTFRTTDTELPNSFTLDEKDIPDVRNQGHVSSCVAFAITNIMQVLNQKETGDREKFSAGYVYGKCRKETATQEGMYTSSALDYLIQTGSCFEEFFPINEEMPEIAQKVKSRPDLDKLAKPYRIKGYEVYAQADRNIRLKKIKSALYKYSTPILGTTDYFGDGHAICIIGYDDETEEFTILNSWGTEWGDNGIGFVPYEDMGRGYLLVDEKNDILMPFTDVSRDRWYYKAVQHAYNAGFMNGTSSNTFEPDKAVTRAELAQALVNFAKKLESIKE